MEPVIEFVYQGKTYPSWGSVSGHYRTKEYDLGKFNRYAKLGFMADDLIKTFKENLSSDHSSDLGRCSYAALLMMKYGVRIGNEDSAEGYVSGMEKTKGELVHTYGTTTLLNKHINFKKSKMYLDFLGKEQVEHHLIIDDSLLIRYGELYYDSSKLEEKWLKLDYDMMFDFVKNEIGEGFIPKDLRTFCANITAWNAMVEYFDLPKHTKRSDAKKEIHDTVIIVSSRLQNTPSVARSQYLDSRMLEWFLEQRMEEEEMEEEE